MNKMIKPTELLYSHHYAEAVELYKQEMRMDPKKNYHRGIGLGLLALTQFDEALKSFRNYEEIASRFKAYSPSFNQIGTVLWMMDKKEEAISEWHRSVAGILDRTIMYGDAAGGAQQGLMLWYGALTSQDKSELDYSIKYLRTRLKRKEKPEHAWPRSILMMIFGEASFDDALSVGLGCSNLDECFEMAKTGLLKRRRLCQALFYNACLHRQNGSDDECKRKMKLCFSLENPIEQCEWYLARSESQN